jgi:hypothetical protein
VANESMIEIFQATVENVRGGSKLKNPYKSIELLRMYLIPKNNLPVNIGSLSSIAFDFYYPNSFFAIGYTNETFVEEGKAQAQFNSN